MKLNIRPLSRDHLIEIYLDWRNNYLTVATYAEHNGLTVEQAKQLISLSRLVFNSANPSL